MRSSQTPSRAALQTISANIKIERQAPSMLKSDLDSWKFLPTLPTRQAAALSAEKTRTLVEEFAPCASQEDSDFEITLPIKSPVPDVDPFNLWSGLDLESLHDYYGSSPIVTAANEPRIHDDEDDDEP
jgi:hypothetical protein